MLYLWMIFEELEVKIIFDSIINSNMRMISLKDYVRVVERYSGIIL